MTMAERNPIFTRTELMLGSAMLEALQRTRVAIFGLGGVGSWCAESLVRTGIGRLMLVDSDRICVTNVNRQLMATTKTVGQIKVEALAARLREINPDVVLDVRQKIYDAGTAAEFDFSEWDYVIDAIDSLESKAHLIRHALSVPSVTLFASMGAALKMDPFQIRQSVFTKVEGDGLARALRQKFRQTGGIPERPFVCVWSPERRENRGPMTAGCGLGQCVCPKGPGPGDPTLAEHEWCSRKARINGTVAHTTAIFGFALAGLVVSDVERNATT
jgi:tRNA A37 threonylcarbamoyladenosine dehydratase